MHPAQPISALALDVQLVEQDARRGRTTNPGTPVRSSTIPNAALPQVACPLESQGKDVRGCHGARAGWGEPDQLHCVVTAMQKNGDVPGGQTSLSQRRVGLRVILPVGSNSSPKPPMGQTSACLKHAIRTDAPDSLILRKCQGLLYLRTVMWLVFLLGETGVEALSLQEQLKAYEQSLSSQPRLLFTGLGQF